MSQKDDLDIPSIRRTIHDCVESIARGGTTEQNGSHTLYLDGYGELMCMWFDDYSYRHPESFVRKWVLNKQEIEIFDRFSDALEDFIPPEGNENISQFHKDPGWQAVVSAAQQALEEWKHLDSWDIDLRK